MQKRQNFYRTGIQAIYISSPASSALLHHYAEKMAFEENAKQYEHITDIFTKANQALEPILLKLRQAKDDPVITAEYQQEAQESLLELGKEALEENGDWVLLHRKKPLELPEV